jgi:hypothetical protein
MTSNFNTTNWMALAHKAAAGIRLRVLEHAVKQSGGYLSQACSPGKRFAVLFCKILNIAQIDEPLVQKPYGDTPGSGMPSVTGRAFIGKDVALLMGSGLFTLSPDLVENCRQFRNKLENA